MYHDDHILKIKKKKYDLNLLYINITYRNSEWISNGYFDTTRFVVIIEILI